VSSEAELRAKVAELERKLERMREALTPSGGTKAAYIGEFFVSCSGTDKHWVAVPWTTIKDVLAAVRKRAGIEGS
jgi:hypothetical protein